MFDLQFLPADAGRLVPMEFGISNCAIRQPNPSSTLPFSPPSLAVPPLKASMFSNPSTDGERLDVGDVADDLEVHGPSSLRKPSASIRRSNIRRSNDRGSAAALDDH